MSFAVTTVEAITVNAGTEQPPAGSVITFTGSTSSAGSTTVAITDPATADNPVIIQLTPDFAEDVPLIAAIATTNVELVVEAQAVSRALSTTQSIQIAVGRDEAGNFLQIGGLVIRGRTANGLTVSLAGGLATQPVPTEKIPPSFRRIFEFGLSSASFARNALASASLERPATPVLNTVTELSLGNDSYLGTEFNDGVVLSPGRDTVVGGGGDDVFAAASSINKAKTKLTMDGSGGNAGAGGRDDLVLARGALKKGKAKIVISDYNKRDDEVILQTKRSNVKGIGTEKLQISTKNDKRIKIISDGTKFKRSGIEFF